MERLLEYRRYKEISSVLSEMAQEAGQRYFRKSTLPEPKHLPPTGLDVKLLWQAFQNVLEGQIEHAPLIANVAREQYTIEDKIVSLLAIFKRKQRQYLLQCRFYAENIEGRTDYNISGNAGTH